MNFNHNKIITPNQFIAEDSSHKLYPWLCWFLASCFIFYKYVLQVSPSVMVSELMQTFSLTGAAMGSLAACYFYAYLLMQLPVGILLDRFNPRYLICGAIIVCASGALLFSQSTHLISAQLGRVLIGVGGAFSAVGTMKIITLWFPAKRFALVSGLMMAMAMLGAIGGEAPLSYLIQQVGWRQAIQWCAVGGLILAFLIGWLIKDKPSDAGVEPLNMRSVGAGLLQLIKNKQTWLISLYSGLAFAPVSAFAGLWGVSFILEKYGVSRNMAASLVSISFVGFAVGAPLAGWLSDKINRRKPIMIIGTSLSLLVLSTIIYCPNIPYHLLALLFLLFGGSSGFFFVSFATIREINSHHLSGTSIGFINMFNALCGALFEPLIGYLLDLGWQHHWQHGTRFFSATNYQHALIILPIGLAIALICQIFIRETFCEPLC